MGGNVGIISALVAVGGMIIGMLQWSLTGNYKRQAELGRQRDATIEKLARRLEDLAVEHARFKDEVHRDFARREMISSIAVEIRQDMSKMFERFDGLSAELNQLIGKIGRRSND